MKTTAPHSMKFLKLKRRLKLPGYAVIGILEALWIFTQTNTPHGDIGRHSDEDIAVGIDWEGDPEKLVADLVECGWLDRCEVHRLLVHDWADHCPNYIRGNIVKKGQSFAVKGEPLELKSKAPKDAPRDTPKVEPKDSPKGAPMEPPSYPILTNPNQTNLEEPPNPPRPGGEVLAPPAALPLRPESDRHAEAYASGQGAADRASPEPAKARPRKAPQRPESVPIPQSLGTYRFQTAWADWIADRKVRSKPMTELAARLQLEKLEELGPEQAVERIHEAIRKGWLGLYPTDEEKQKPTIGSKFRPNAIDLANAAAGPSGVDPLFAEDSP